MAHSTRRLRLRLRLPRRRRRRHSWSHSLSQRCGRYRRSEMEAGSRSGNRFEIALTAQISAPACVLYNRIVPRPAACLSLSLSASLLPSLIYIVVSSHAQPFFLQLSFSFIASLIAAYCQKRRKEITLDNRVLFRNYLGKIIAESCII